MRVWIENPFDNLPGEGARPGRYELMAKAFADAGHEVVWWTSDFSHVRKARRTCESPASLAFAVRLVPTVPYRGNVSLGRILSHRGYARAWRKLALAEIAAGRGPSLLVVSSPPLKTGDVALEIRRRCGCRLIVDVQDLWPECFGRVLPRWLRPFAPLLFLPFARSARRICRGADLVTGVCDAYAKTVRARGAKEYYRAYLGIVPTGGAGLARPAHRIRRLVYLGNLGFGYDLATVIRAVNSSDDLSLDVAGVAAPRREGRVAYHGYLGAGELAALLARCDAGIVPMRADSFVGIPNKVADYAAAGLPIISSLGGELAELLAETGAGVTYAPGDERSLVAAVEGLSSRVTDTTELVRRLDARTIYRGYVAAALGEKP